MNILEVHAKARAESARHEIDRRAALAHGEIDRRAALAHSEIDRRENQHNADPFAADAGHLINFTDVIGGFDL